eukprot:jgi/Mesvir1/1720/Mv21173-RA.1
MFIYLSKKIAIPNGLKLKCVSWNSEQGWIACGGESGLLKVLKLESATGGDKKGAVAAANAAAAAASSNLSMNQTLEGHNGSVMVVNWNENYRKLTTSDENGLIIVWMLHKGMWFEEMINNRNKSVVRDMKWTSDGQKICIVYEDGAVILGSVDGNRLWGKELTLQLTLVEWSPNCQLILFTTVQGEVHIYDGNGNPMSKMVIYCQEGASGPANVVGVNWYDGLQGYPEPNSPSLAVAFDNGRIQIMRNEFDDKPVLIDTGMHLTKVDWNGDGTVLAVAGTQKLQVSGENRETSMVQFYSYDGNHLRTLRVPGGGISALSWEGGGLRIALAVDSFIYFANIRRDYKWGYFGTTVVYAFAKPERPEMCIMFWDTSTNDRYAKYVKKLIAIQAHGEYCVLSTKGEEPGQYILILCNAIGSPVDSKYIDVEPVYLCMTDFHVVAASDEVVFVWQYRTAVSKLSSALDAMGGVRRKEGGGGRERMFHIDVLPTNEQGGVEKFKRPLHPTEDPIACICASEKVLMVGRESGIVHGYGLPHLTLENKYILRCRPQVLALNCNSTRMSIIDINGVLSFFDTQAQSAATPGVMGEHLPFERKDAWFMKWAADNPDLLAMMEKTRMYIFRGMDPEEPVLSSAYICEFKDLQIKAVMLDDVFVEPDNPDKSSVIHYETKSLRDTRHILANVSIADAYQFIEDNSHPMLWRQLAEHALNNLDFTIADKAFVRCTDYQGIQLVKRLQMLDDKAKQRAEVAVYFKRFDEAEALYREMDRMDLAIEMRMRLGDWFTVEKLVTEGGGDDALLVTAWNRMGDYYADRQKWSKAVQYYAQAKNSERLVECFYMLEDFSGLEKLIYAVPEGSPLLPDIAEKFLSVGLCEQAVAGYLKAGEVKAAIDCCVLLNQWDQAVELAEKHDLQQIEALLTKYANHLLDKAKPLHAIELYRKAGRHTEAAKLLNDLANKAAKSRVNPMRVKKLYVLAGLEIELFKKKTLDLQMGDGGGRKTQVGTAAATLDGLMVHEAATQNNKALENAWRGAEAYHLLLLAHRQLYNNQIDAAMKTSLRLREYEDLLEPVDLFSFLALTCFYNKYYRQCSNAINKLEMLDGVDTTQRDAYCELGVAIFSRYPPNDPNARRLMCPECQTNVNDWSTRCPKPGCDTQFPMCVATGRAILTENRTKCRACKHYMISAELRGRVHCPLCHSGLQKSMDTGGGRGYS